MAHRTRINGTGYDIPGGRDLIGGTGYAKKKGRVLVNGTGYDVSLAKIVPLSAADPGSVLMLNENGNTVPFYICKHDYESGLNGAGHTLVVRKDCYDKRAFGTTDNWRFDHSTISGWLDGTYLNLLSENVKTAIGTTKYYGRTEYGVATMQSSVFLLSAPEISGQNASTYGGTQLPIADMLKIAYLNGATCEQWTRSSMKSYSSIAGYIYTFLYFTELGTENFIRDGSSQFGIRPAFTLPSKFPLIQNADGSYSPAA